MCEEIEMSIQEYQAFIYKREEVKPYLKELDNIFQSTDQLDELDRFFVDSLMLNQ